jgi:hypothetical protein
MSPLNDAVISTPPTIQITTPSSPPEPCVSPTPITDVSDAESAVESKLDGSRHSLEKAMNLIINVKTLTKLCDVEGADAVRIGDTLMKQYNDICETQAYRIKAREISHNNLLTILEQESVFDDKVAAHYDRFVREMEEAETAMGEQHKQAMMMDAMKSIRLAREYSQRARDLRKKIVTTKAKLRLTDSKMMAARDKLVDLLYSAVLYCLEPETGEDNKAG